MPVIKFTIYCLAFGVIAACTSTPHSTTSLKPYSSLFGEGSSCDLGQICDYTGAFDRQATDDPNIPDALYTYDDDNKCVLIITDQDGLQKYDSELNAVNLSGGDISISAQAVKRDSLINWSESSFCNDSDTAFILKTVDAVLIMYH